MSARSRYSRAPRGRHCAILPLPLPALCVSIRNGAEEGVIKKLRQLVSPTGCHNVKVLACGGDGTIGWVGQTIRDLGLSTAILVPVPLGTGATSRRCPSVSAAFVTDQKVPFLADLHRERLRAGHRLGRRVRRGDDGGKTPPLPCVSTASVAKTLPFAMRFHCLRS